MREGRETTNAITGGEAGSKATGAMGSGEGGDGDWEAVIWSMREREFRTTRHLSMRERPTS
jgi:hypothetical protein